MSEPCKGPPWTAERLRDLLTRLGIPQSELADVIGVDAATVSRWLRAEDVILMRGRVAPVLDQLQAQITLPGFRDALRMALATHDLGALSAVIWGR